MDAVTLQSGDALLRSVDLNESLSLLQPRGVVIRGGRWWCVITGLLLVSSWWLLRVVCSVRLLPVAGWLAGGALDRSIGAASSQDRSSPLLLLPAADG